MSQQSVSPATILIVEDEPLVRLCAAEMLIDSGFQVIEASSAVPALEILAARSDVAVLFTDIEMPGDFDGLDLALVARRDRPDLKIVLTSGRVRLAEHACPPGAVFLGKPYVMEQLLSVIGCMQD